VLAFSSTNNIALVIVAVVLVLATVKG